MVEYPYVYIMYFLRTLYFVMGGDISHTSLKTRYEDRKVQDSASRDLKKNPASLDFFRISRSKVHFRCFVTWYPC